MSADERTRIHSGLTDTAPGTQLSGIYELDQRLGSGGMGEVWRGHNIQTGDLVAIKIVLPEFARDQTILSLFRKEATVLNHLSHEAVVRYHVFTIDPGIGRPYLAMEYVDGDSLFDVTRRGPMPPDDVRRLCHRLASGLGAVHLAGAIHRDLSPDNIILPGGSVERAKIIDFGIARSAKVGGETLIGGRFAGKYNYVSPEQLGLYGGEVSERSDIYSLGLVLAAALRGEPLDMSGSQLDIIEKRRSVPDLSGIDGEMRRVLEAMLQPDPRDRPASMAEVARMTRGGSQVEHDEAPPPAPAAWSPAPKMTGAGSSAAPSQADTSFVEHVRPAYLSQPRAPSKAPPPTTPQPATARRRSGAGYAAAAVLALLAVTAAGAWVGLLPLPWTEPETVEGDAPPLKPAQPDEIAANEDDGPAAPPPIESPEPAPDAVVEPTLPREEPIDAPEPEQPAIEQAEVTDEPPEPATPRAEPPKAEPAPVAEESRETAAGDPAQEAAPTAEEILDSLIRQVESRDETEPPSEDVAAADPADTVAPRPDEQVLRPAPEPERPVNEPPTASPSPERTEPADVATEPTPAPAEEPEPEPVQPESVEAEQSAPRPDPPEIAEDGDDLRPPPFEGASQEAAPEPVASDTPSPEPAPSLDIPAEAPAQEEPAREETVTMNVPKPVPPAPPVSPIAERVAWVRDYSGGDCFAAAPIAATDSSIRIEGFGTSTAPFNDLLVAFETRFGIEPDIEVRLIDATQCAVTRFIRDLPADAAERQDLTIDQMSIASGGTLSGAVSTEGGARASLLLIDHDGMVLSLDQVMVDEGSRATFQVPITLDADDTQAGRPLPELLIAITGESELRAAELRESTSASVLLPRILAEIEQARNRFSVTTKYFQIGG